MAADQAVILALLGTTGISAYYAMQFSRSEDWAFQTLGFLFFGNSLAFLGLSVYTASIVAESLTNLTPLLNSALLVMTWVLVLVGGVLWFYALYKFGRAFYDAVTSFTSGRQRRRSRS